MACEQDCRCNACVCDMFDCVKNQAPAPEGYGGMVATLGRNSNQPDGLAVARRLAIARGRGRAPDRAAGARVSSPTVPDGYWWQGPGPEPRATPSLDFPSWERDLCGKDHSIRLLTDPPNVDLAVVSPVVPHVTPDPGADRSPGTDRLRLASSSDGLSWTHYNLSVATRSAVPTMVEDQGTLYLFMVMANADTESGSVAVYNGLVVGTTNDLWVWSFEQVVIYFRERWDAGDFDAYEWDTSHPVDPCVVWDATGSVWRMYFTLITTDGLLFRSFSAQAPSPAGPWTAENGFRYSGPDLSMETLVMDPTVLWVGDQWIFFGGTGEVGVNHYASSGDGLTFTPIDDGYLEPNWEGYPTMMANGLEMDGVYRFYAFAVELGKPAPKDESAGFPPAFIVSFWWDAGAGEWLPDADPRLELDPADGAETRFVMDPAVARFGDCWVMAYVTEAPESA